MKKNMIADGVFYAAGSVIYSLSVNVFTAPNHIAPGGITGIGTLVNYLCGFPIGTFILLANLPLLYLTWAKISRSLAVRTSIVTVALSVVMDFTAGIIPPFRGDMMLTAVFGGVLSGLGIGMIYMRGATTGGSELIARLIGKKFRHLPIGRLILIVDACVVASSALVYRRIEAALYAMVLIYVSTAIMDGLVYGTNRGRMLLIVTDRGQEVAAEIMKKLTRGVTVLDATGAYTGKGREVLLCAVRPSEVYALRTLVEERDPAAFMIITTSEEIVGQGFKPHPGSEK